MKERFERILIIRLPKETLHWLLEDKNPPVRNLTKEYLQNIKPTQTELAQVYNYPPIKSMLSLMKLDGTWSDPKNPYKKYKFPHKIGFKACFVLKKFRGLEFNS